MLNLAHYLDATARQFPDVIAARFEEMQVSYRQMAAAARKVANILKAKGIGPGDKVAMMMTNTPYFPVIYYGILHTGAVVVPVNTHFQRQEIEHYLSDSEAVAFFALSVLAPQATAAFQQVESCKHLIIAGPLDYTETPETGENMMHLFGQVSDEFDTVQTKPQDTAVILFTSGTTGAPKGAELSHFNLFFNAYYVGREVLGVQPGDAILVTLPLFHSFGQTCLMNASIFMGGCMSMLPRFETQKALDIIQQDRIVFTAMVPTMYAFILNQPGDFDLSSIRVALSGGAALSTELHEQFLKRFGVYITEGYGLSETSPVASVTSTAGKVGSIGRPIWGVQMAVKRDDETFAEPGEVGELVIRGHNVMKRYYNRPEATREAMKNGWFHTGDIARQDEDGFFFIVDRKKDIIIRAGLNIYPREIEEVLYTHPKVLEAAVVGIPDELRGEEVKIFVSARQGETLTAREITAFIQERLAKFKWPKEVEILSELPKGATGKILKKELRARHV